MKKHGVKLHYEINDGPHHDNIPLAPPKPKEDVLKSKFWSFRFEKKKEYILFGTSFYNDKIQIVQRIKEHKRWARVKHNSNELIGIIEFDNPVSKDWVQQNISFDAIWAPFKKLSDPFVHIYFIRLQGYDDDINDGPHPNDDPKNWLEDIHSYRYDYEY
jgi:hypothetical protein